MHAHRQRRSTRVAPVVLALCALACDDEPSAVLDPVPSTTVRFRIPALPEGRACYALTVRGFDSTWYSSTLPYWGSYAAAREAGGLCGDTDFEHVVGCHPGMHTAGLTGIIYEGDAPHHRYHMGAVTQSFRCEADVETVVQLPRPTAYNVMAQGFLELQVQLDSEPSLVETCMTARIENGDGLIVANIVDLCTSQYGDHRGLIYVTNCDAESQPARVRLVIDDIQFAEDVPAADRKLVNPCPPGNATHMYWSHACVTEVVCRANADVQVPFDLVLAKPQLDPR